VNSARSRAEDVIMLTKVGHVYGLIL